MNITNMNFLIRFNKAREIFPRATRVLSILLTASATSASVESTNFKVRVAYCLVTCDKKSKFPGSSPGASGAQR